MSNFASLHTALTGLRGAQVGLDTAAHNISNARTEGFTRQRVAFTTRPAYQSLVGPVGTGVQVGDIARTRDMFLDARVRAASASAADARTTADLLSKVEGILAEPENGISVELTELWAAFEDLGLDPSDVAARRQVMSSLQSLAGRVRTIDAGLDRLAQDTAQRHEVTIDEVNDLLKDVAELNEAIAATLAREGTPNDLLDARDIAIDALSAKLGIDEPVVIPDSGGMVRISIGGVDLVDGLLVTDLDVTAGPPISLEAGGNPVTPQGEVGALQSFLNTGLPDLRSELEAFVTDLRVQLNAQHAAGHNPGGDLLVGDASTLQVGITDPSQIAAGLTAAPYDGGNAVALAALGADLDERVRALATDLGRQVASATRAEAAQEGLAASASYARMNQHGVSLDEEMVSLVAFQRSLEAASRMMTAIDSALDTLINRTGLVGR